MTEVRIIIWFTWFVAGSWIRNASMLLKERLLKGVWSLRKTPAQEASVR
jgi:hypothetical protein